MADRAPRRRLIETFGSYNDLSPNPYSDSERILDVRNGILDPYTQIAQNALQTSYTVDSLSAFGNTFRARILGVARGKPARHLYPGLYANSTSEPRDMPEYWIFVLRDESDQFAPDPSHLATTVGQYVNTIGLQGRAISEQPAPEGDANPYSVGSIVEVYKPEQNSWNGALVRRIIVRNNFSADVVEGRGASSHHDTTPGQPYTNGSTDEVSYTPILATASDVEGRLGTRADWDEFNPGVVYPAGSMQLMELFVEAARRANPEFPDITEEWGRLPGLVGSVDDIAGGGLVHRESRGGVVGVLNFTFQDADDPDFLPNPWNRGKDPDNIKAAIDWFQDDGNLRNSSNPGAGVKLPAGVDSSAIGLGQLLSPAAYEHMPEHYGGYGIPMQEAIGMLRYIFDRYKHPNSGYSFHAFPKPTYLRGGGRQAYLGSPAEHHRNATHLIMRRVNGSRRYFHPDTDAPVPYGDIDFWLDQAVPPNRVRMSSHFTSNSRLGQITLAGYDEFDRPEVKVHEGY